MTDRIETSRDDNDILPDAVPRRPGLYPVITIVWGVALLVGVMMATNWTPSKMMQFDTLNLWQQVVIVIAIAWPILSIRQIGLSETVAVTFFGTPVSNLGPGLKFYPYLLFTFHRYTRSVQQKQFPGDPEKVFGGDDKDELPPGMVRPLRITTGKPATDTKNPLDIQMVVEFLYYLRIQVSDPLRFLIQFGSVDEFWRQIRDTGDRILTKKVSQTEGAAKLIEGIDDLMNELEGRFREIAARGGVRVVESGLNSPNISHTLAEEIRNIGVSKATAKQTQIKSEGERMRLANEGRGRAEAEAALIAALEEKLSTAGENTLIAYAGEKILSDKTTVLGMEGIAQAYGLLKQITEKRSAE